MQVLGLPPYLKKILTTVLWHCQEYLTYIELIVQQRWAKVKILQHFQEYFTYVKSIVQQKRAKGVVRGERPPNFSKENLAYLL